MLDGLGGLTEGFVKAASGFSGSATLIALVAFSLEFVRGRSETKSFRPAVGWLIAVLGVFGAISAIIALRDNNVSPLSRDGRLLGLFLVACLVMAVAGGLMAALTPSADRGALRELASAVEAAVQRSDADDDFVRANHVPLGFSVAYQRAWTGETETSNVRKLSPARLPTASVSVLAGSTGSGKSVSLRHLVLNVCRDAVQARRPKQLAVYVSVRRLPAITGPITQDVLLRQLEQAVAEDNTVLGDRLARYLAGEARGTRWVFAFDLDGELTRDQQEQYFEALRNFMRHRERDRAVIAVREAFPDARPVFTPREPSARQVRELLGRQGIHDVDDQLIRDRSMRAIFASPAMIMQLGPHVVSAPLRSQAAILDAFVAARLNRHSAVNQSSESLRHKAESLAYGFAFKTADLVADEADIAPMLAARLGRIEGTGFLFRVPLLLTHLAAAYLVRTRPELDLEHATSTDETRRVLVEALRLGDAGFKASLMTAVRDLVRSVVRKRGDSAALPPLGTFSWPPPVLHALTVLRDADEVHDTNDDIDRLIWLGMFGGGRHDREAALSLLPLASASAVAALHRQAVVLKYDARTTSQIAEHLRWDPTDPDHMALRNRVIVVVNALAAWGDDQFLTDRPASGPDLLLVPMLQALLTIGRIVLGGTAVLFFWLAVTTPPVAEAAVVGGFALLMGILLWSLRKDARSLTELTASLAFIVICMSGAVLGGVSLLLFTQIFVDLFARNFGAVPRLVLALWMSSWPLATAVLVVHAPHRHHHEWFPQRRLKELWPYRHELAPYTGRLAARFQYLRSPWRIAVLVVLGVIMAALPIDMPIRGEVERYFDYPLIIVVVVGAWWITMRSGRFRKHADAAVLGRQVFGGGLTEVLLFREFTEAAGRSHAEVTKLLKVLAAAPDGALLASVRVLESLDKLLEFLARTLPDTAKDAIKPGLWLYAPEACSADLLDWAAAFDRRHTGFLLKLANSDEDRNLLSSAMRSATAQYPVSMP